MSNDWMQSLLNECYAGDEKAFMAARRQGIASAVSWKEVAENEPFPEHKQLSQTVIFRLLGYNPPARVTQPYENSIRQLIDHFKNGKIDDDRFFYGAVKNVKKIRNKELRGQTIPYGPEIYEQYENFLPQYKCVIRERIVKLMGYQPALEDSIGAELFLRKQFVSDKNYLPEGLCSLDMQAITLILFRENIRLHGLDKANAADLVRQIYKW